MKKKQIAAIIITAVIMIAVGVTGVVSNVVQHKIVGEAQEDVKTTFFDIVNSQSADLDLPEKDFIGILNIVGEIGASDESFSSAAQYNHDLYMEYVEQMKKAPNNKGILIYVDSPGGAVYQTDELYLKIMEYKEETGRPVWAYFASQACSGGYYIAMAADKIYANRNCWTGSIGVIVSLVNCKELYDKLGIKEIDITSGRNKAMGSAGLNLTKEQYGILQSLVDEAYSQFVQIVSEGRHMDEDKVRKLADGRIYSANQAVENGLIDAVDSLEAEKEALIEENGLDEEIEFYAPENTVNDFWYSLFSKAGELFPKTEIDLASDIVENQGNGVLKYYAK